MATYTDPHKSRKSSRYYVQHDLLRQFTTIPAAAVLTLNASPVTIVDAPGAGYVLEFVSAHLWLDHAGTDYDGIAAGEDLEIRYTNLAGAEVASVETTGFLDASADAHRIIAAGAAAVATPAGVAPVANAALVLGMSTDEIATGDGILKVSVLYRRLLIEPTE